MKNPKTDQKVVGIRVGQNYCIYREKGLWFYGESVERMKLFELTSA